VPVIIYLLFPSDKSKIGKLFRRGAAAVEAKKTEDVMAKVSFNYTDEHGLSYLYLRKALEGVFGGIDRVKVNTRKRASRSAGGHSATADLDIRATASRGRRADR
jgi:hypothetical protein